MGWEPAQLKATTATRQSASVLVVRARGARCGGGLGGGGDGWAGPCWRRAGRRCGRQPGRQRGEQHDEVCVNPARSVSLPGAVLTQPGVCKPCQATREQLPAADGGGGGGARHLQRRAPRSLLPRTLLCSSPLSPLSSLTPHTRLPPRWARRRRAPTPAPRVYNSPTRLPPPPRLSPLRAPLPPATH